MPAYQRRTTDLLSELLTQQASDRISLEALIQPLQRRAFGFLLLLLAIPSFIPVPLGVSGPIGILVSLLGLQMLLGMPQPWLPHWLRRRTLSRQALQHFLQRIGPLTRRLEKLCKPRLERLTRQPLTMVSGLIMMLLGLFLALPIPFTNYLFGVLLLAFAFALIEHDGVLLLLIWLATLGCVLLSATFIRQLL